MREICNLFLNEIFMSMDMNENISSPSFGD